jgi:hypothetical protein
VDKGATVLRDELSFEDYEFNVISDPIQNYSEAATRAIARCATPLLSVPAPANNLTVKMGYSVLVESSQHGISTVRR